MLNTTDTKEKKNALRESELSYRTIFEAATDAIFLHDPNTGRIVDVNEAACRLLGYSREEMKALDFAQAGSGTPTYANKEVMEWVRKAVEEGPQCFNWMEKRRDGKLIWFENSLKRVTIGGQDLVLVVARDITERKHAEAALNEREERFRSLVEHSHAGIFMVDEFYRFVYVNDRFCRIMGYSREELAGCDFRKFLAEESLAQVSDYYVRRQRGEQLPECYEIAIVRKDGEKRMTELSVAVITDAAGKRHSVGQVLDITERKAAEEALQKSEEKYRNIFDSAVEGFFQTTVDGKFLSMNFAGAKMLGYDSSKELVSAITDLSTQGYVDPEERVRFKNIIEAQGWVRGFETQHYRRDGSISWVSLNARAVKDAEGKTLYYEGVIQEITERKRMQEEKEKLILELQEALAKVKTLTGLLPICASCKKIRNDKGQWEQMEVYIRDRSDAEFTHGLCPKCARRLYPEAYEEE